MRARAKMLYEFRRSLWEDDGKPFDLGYLMLALKFAFFSLFWLTSESAS